MTLRRFLRRVSRDSATLAVRRRRRPAFPFRPAVERLEEWNLPNLLGPAPGNADAQPPANQPPARAAIVSAPAAQARDEGVAGRPAVTPPAAFVPSATATSAALPTQPLTGGVFALSWDVLASPRTAGSEAVLSAAPLPAAGLPAAAAFAPGAERMPVTPSWAGAASVPTQPLPEPAAGDPYFFVAFLLPGPAGLASVAGSPMGLLGLAGETLRPDIASGARTTISYTATGTGSNPFHYDSVPLQITLGDGSILGIGNPSAGGPARIELDVNLNDAGVYAGAALADFSLTGRIVIGPSTFDGTLLTARVREFGARVDPANTEFEVRLVVTGGALARKPDGLLSAGNEMALLIHQPGLPIAGFPQSFAQTTFLGSSDLRKVRQVNTNSDPADCGCGGAAAPAAPPAATTGDAQDTRDGVFPHNGAARQSMTDLVIPGRGLDYRLDRTYRSDVQCSGPLGHNWEHNSNRRLTEVNPNNLTEARQSFPGAQNGDVLRMDGYNRADLYVRNPGLPPTYTSPNGFFTRLFRNPDGTFRERDGSGLAVTYAAADATGAAVMTSTADRNGNTLRYAYDALGRLQTVTDTLGRPITYTYDPNSQLQQVTDFTGRAVRYTYDAIGRLETVTTPAVTGTPTGNDFPGGKTTRYTYSSGLPREGLNHNLTGVIAPSEVADGSLTPRVRYTYDNSLGSPNFDRVLTQDVGGTNGSGVPAGGTLRYSYDFLGTPPPGDFATPMSRTTVLDRNSNRAEYLFNRQGNIVDQREFTNRDLRPAEPAFYETRYVYDGDYRLLQVTEPEGNTTDYVYDTLGDRYQQGNMLSRTQTPDAGRGGDQASIQTNFVYEPIYNQLRTMTEARGTDPAFRPPLELPGETFPNPARYTTESFYDYQEGLDFAGLATELGTTPAAVMALLTAYGVFMGLGDLNSDGTDSQINGNPVATFHPTVNFLPGSNMAVIEPLGPQQFIIDVFTYNQFGQLTRFADPEANVDRYAYYPENDPNGDGVIDFPAGDPTTGGYLRQSTRDTDSAAGRDSGTDPTPVQIRTQYGYDAVGNVTRTVDGRGIATDYVYNQLNQVVQTVRAAANGIFAPDPFEPAPLTDFRYLERFSYDFNDNVVLSQVEDRGNTSSVDGNPPAAVLPAGVPGAANPDPVGGPAFVDTVYQYDILDHRVRTVQEVENGATPLFLGTRYRYDANENRVLTIRPEGNASSAVYDERDLLFQATGGAAVRPAEGLYAPGDPTTFDRPGGAGTAPSTYTYNYDGNRNAIEAVDAEPHGGTGSTLSGVGDATRYTYDGYDRLRSVVDPLGNQTRYSYDPDGNVVRTVQEGDPVDDVVGAGKNRPLAVTEYLYDELSRRFLTHEVLFRTPDAVPARTPALTDTPAMDPFAAYLADAPNDTAAVPGAAGITVIGRISTVDEYDRNSRMTFTVQDDLDVTRTFYDGADRVIRTVDSVLGNGFAGGMFNPGLLSGNTVEAAYDDNDNVIERLETDVTTVRDVPPEQFRTTYLYDSLDRLQTAFDNRGQATDYRYDSRDNLVASADAVGPVTARTLNRRGLGSAAAVAVNDFGNVTRYRYDGLGRQVEAETMLAASGQGNGTYLGATIEGVLVAPPPGYLATFLSGDGLISTYYAYDGNSQVLALRDDNGNTTAYIYDNQDRTLVERKGLNETGTAFTVAGGDNGRFNVPLRGGVAPVDTEPAGTDINTTYDRDSNVATMLNEGDVAGRRSTLTYSYDALNRRKTLAVTNPLGSQFIGTTQQTWTYDGLSRLTESFDNNEPVPAADDVTTRYFYDSLSRKVEEQQRIDALPFRASTSPYDVAASGAVGQPSGLVYPDGRQTDYTYDGLDRLVARRDAGAATDIGRYEYIGAGRVAVLTYQNNTRLTHIGQVAGFNADVGYDNLRRVVNHRWEAFAPGMPLGLGALVVGFDHQDGAGNPAYDRANNKLIEEKLHDGGNSEVYTYDSAYRLVTFNRGTLNAAQTAIAIVTLTPNALMSQTWSLDGTGNWSSNRHITTGVIRMENRTHTDFNEIGTVAGTPYGGGATGTHVLDENGNLLDDGVRIYQYDALNRLRRVSRTSDGMQIAEYAYDSMNRRLRKVVTNGGLDGTVPNGTTHFYYDGWRVMEERDGADAITQQYVYGNNLDEVWTLDNRRGGIAVPQLNDGVGNERSFYHDNTLGSTYGLTGETGQLREAYQYDAYGRATVFVAPGPDGVWFTGDEPQAPTSAVNSPYAYTGQRLDPDTRLLYFKNRYFSTDLGRYLQRDPLGYGDGLNLYEYVQSAPTNATDPLGLLKDKKVFEGTLYEWEALYRNSPSLYMKKKRDYKVEMEFECDIKGEPKHKSPVVITGGMDSSSLGFAVVGVTDSHWITAEAVYTYPDCPPGSTGKMVAVELTISYLHERKYGVTIGLGPLSADTGLGVGKGPRLIAKKVESFVIDCCCPPAKK